MSYKGNSLLKVASVTYLIRINSSITLVGFEGEPEVAGNNFDCNLKQAIDGN